MNKKGQVGLIALGIVGVVLLLTIGLSSWLLSKSLFLIVGGIMLIVAVVALARGIKVPNIVWLIGIILTIMSFVFKFAQGLTLAAVMG